MIMLILVSWCFGIFGMLCVQEMTPDADIISSRYTKSVIKSCAAMSYVEAQARMDDRCFLAFSCLSLHYLYAEIQFCVGLAGQKHCHKIDRFIP